MDDALVSFMRQAADDSRLAAAKAERQAARWHDQAAGESMTLAGLLLDLHERGASVHLDTKRGHRRHGVISAVGFDCIAISSSEKPTVLIRTREISSVKLDRPGSPLGPVSDRVVESGATFEGLMNDLCQSQSVVRLRIGDTDVAHTGELAAVGADLVALKTGGDVCYLPIEQISELTVG